MTLGLFKKNCVYNNTSQHWQILLTTMNTGTLRTPEITLKSPPQTQTQIQTQDKEVQ